jgi:hypothetical protein
MKFISGFLPLFIAFLLACQQKSYKVLKSKEVQVVEKRSDRAQAIKVC